MTCERQASEQKMDYQASEQKFWEYTKNNPPPEGSINVAELAKAIGIPPMHLIEIVAQIKRAAGVKH